jgi:hypothetical protein
LTAVVAAAVADAVVAPRVAAFPLLKKIIVASKHSF